MDLGGPHEAAKEISEALKDEGALRLAGGAYNQELFYNLIFQAGGAVLTRTPPRRVLQPRQP